MRQTIVSLREVGARLLVRLATALDPASSAGDVSSRAESCGDEVALHATPQGPVPSVHSGPERDTSTPDGVPAAQAVLAVAELVTNQELARRLVEAVGGIPGVVPIRPEPGDPYDPLEHELAEVRPTSVAADAEHVAELLSPGFRGFDSGLIRPAKVAIHDLMEM